MQWHKSIPVRAVEIDPPVVPMRMVDLEMAECLRRVNLLTMVNNSQDSILKEVLSVVTKYLTHRTMGADDVAIHDLKYARILCDTMLDRMEGLFND